MNKLFQTCRYVVILAGISASVFACADTHAQGTAFSFQGRLNDAAGPANGDYDIRFTLYDSTNVPGNVVAGPLTILGNPVTGGYFNATLDFGSNVFTGQPLWLQLEVRTNGALNYIALSPRQPLLATPYAVAAGKAATLTGMLPASQISGAISSAQLPANALTEGQTGAQLNGLNVGGNLSVTGTNFVGSLVVTNPPIMDGSGIINLHAAQIVDRLSLSQLPSGLLTNGGAVKGAFTGDASGLTNLNWVIGSPYSLSHANAALALWTVAADGNKAPLFTVSQDYGYPNMDGTATTWGYNLSGDQTYNAGRFFGASWNWQLASPGTDIRDLILKGAASQSQHDGAYFILETTASDQTPGNHGLFNNSLYVSRKGLMGLGNLTDASDTDTSLPFEQYLTAWVNIFPDGSSWSGSSGHLPPLVIYPQKLVPTPVRNAVENDGSSWWLTDNSGNRTRILTAAGSTQIFAHINGTNVFFSTQP